MKKIVSQACVYDKFNPEIKFCSNIHIVDVIDIVKTRTEIALKTQKTYEIKHNKNICYLLASCFLITHC